MTRSTQTEWMDTEAVTPADFAACLHDLAQVNTVTLARLPTLGFMRRLVRRHPGRPFRVLDVGCGEGDMLRRLARWAVRAGHRVEWLGLDRNPLGIAAARAATPASLPIRYIEADVFDPALPGYDAIISSLFTHHLDEGQLAAFLRLMEARAALGWFVNDLHRHPLAFHGFGALSAVARWHRFVRHDGPISVARAFRRADWTRLLHEAGVPGTVRWHLPFRYTVTRLR